MTKKPRSYPRNDVQFYQNFIYIYTQDLHSSLFGRGRQEVHWGINI